MQLKELKEKGKKLSPILQVGKNGLGEGQIAELKRTLQLKKLIKVKLLKGFFEGKNKKDLGKDIAEKTNSIFVEQVGNVVVLYKGRIE